MDRKEPILKEIIRRYSEESFESSSKLTLSEARKKFSIEEHFYDELKKEVVNGFPIGSEFVAKDGSCYRMDQYDKLSDEVKRNLRLRYYYLSNMHEIYIGTTGSGKTTGCVEPQVRAIVTQKNKPSIFLTDPKGEIFNRNAEYIKKNGYDVYVLNFKDIRKSDRWNPLGEIYDTYMEKRQFFKESNFIKEEGNYSFKGMKFNSQEEMDLYVSQEIERIDGVTGSLVKSFAEIIVPVTSKDDRTWEQGAQSMAEGIIFAMLNAAFNYKETGFTEDMFTIKTFFDYYHELSKSFDGSTVYNYSDIEKHILVNYFPIAANKLMAVYGNAERTRKGYIGVFDSATHDWKQTHIFSLTTGSTINFEKSKKPFAIFIITRDYEKSDFKIAGLFIDYVYRTLLKEAEDKMLRNEPIHDFHFILDEFGNIPKIPSFDNKIATARSRKLWMHIFVQSYEQIYNVYTDHSEADVILSNCNSRIFLGSQSYKTIETFSNECGRKTVNIGGINNSDNVNLTETNVLLKSDLDLIDVGSMYMKRIYMPVIYTHFIRSYFLGENGFYQDFNRDGLITCTPTNNVVYSLDKYTYKPKRPKIKRDPFDFDFS